MKALRYALWGLLAIIVVVVAVVVIALYTINPNDYKPQIEKVVESHSNLNLQLKGNIGWSLIPIGLKLNDVQANLEGKPFVKVNKLVAQIDFWSLLAFHPSVDTFVLDGLDANLVRNKQGQGNWERIVPQGKQTPSQAPAKQAQAASTTPAQKPKSNSSLQFNVHDVKIKDAQLHYSDLGSGQAVDLNKVNLSASGIAPDAVFPVNLSFQVANTKPKLDVNGKLSARISFDGNFQHFIVNGLSSSFDLSGAPFGGKTVNAGLDTSLTANLKDKQADIRQLKLSFANVTVNGNLQVQGFDQPKLSGKLSIPAFSPQKLLAALGQPPIKTRDDKVLQKLALDTDIGGGAGDIQLKPFTLTLDSTSLKGGLEYRLKSGYIGVNLNGNQMDLDNYLPPKETAKASGTSQAGNGKQEKAAHSGSGGPKAAPEQDLLPLKTIRALVFNVKLALDKLTASNLKISNIKVDATGNKGLIQVNKVNGDLYQGSFVTQASLDARGDNPTWKLQEALSGVQTLPLLTDLAKVDLVSGAVNAKADVTSKGNRISALRSNATGQASFVINKGVLHGFNLKAYACQGIAKINRASIDTSSWADQTDFDKLDGVVKINGNTLNNTSLTAQLAGMNLGGQGTINLQQMKLNYELGLKIVGAIDKDKACGVNPRVQGLVIPVKCEGSLTGANKSLCRFDSAKFGDVLKHAAENAGKQKLHEEINKGLNKLLKKNGSSNKNSDNSLKNKLKGLFQ